VIVHFATLQFGWHALAAVISVCSAAWIIVGGGWCVCRIVRRLGLNHGPVDRAELSGYHYPPEDKHQKAISPCPSKYQTSAPKKAPTNTPPQKSNLASQHSSPGIPTTSQPHATLQDAAPQVNSSFFATKHAKKGSPRKKKARTLTSSPPREDMSTGGTQEVKWSLPTGSPITSLTNSHQHLLLPSEDFDEYDTDQQEPSQDSHYNKSNQQRSPSFSNNHSEDSSNHMLQRSPSQDNAQTYHDAQEMGFNHHDQTHPEDHSLQSSYSSPSTSIQYNSPNAGLEGNND
jgi:hypothetical protein